MQRLYFLLVIASRDHASPAQLKLEFDWIKTRRQETANEHQGNSLSCNDYWSSTMMKNHKFCTALAALNSMIVITSSWAFALDCFFKYSVYPQEHHMKSRCFHGTESCLSRFLSPACFYSTVCGQSCAYCTFPGRLWNPLAVLIWNAQEHRITIATKTAELGKHL